MLLLILIGKLTIWVAGSVLLLAVYYRTQPIGGRSITKIGQLVNQVSAKLFYIYSAGMLIWIVIGP